MQESLRQGTIGRVMLDRNTGLHFLNKSGLIRKRQIRTIRYIDYPMEYYLAHVRHYVNSHAEVFNRKFELTACGESLEELSADLVAGAEVTSIEELTHAELQVVNSFFLILYISPRAILLFVFSIYSDAIHSLKIIYFFVDS